MNINKKRIKFLEIGAYILVILSMIVISLYNTRLAISDIFVPRATYFPLFAVFAFIILPIALPLFSVASWLKVKGTIKIKELIAFICLGFAATNLHDVVWCYVKTEGYSIAVPGGHDLDIWSAVYHLPSDYITFGAVMFIQMIIFLGVAFYILRNKIDLIYVSFTVVVTGIIIYILDSPPHFRLYVTLPVFLSLLILPLLFKKVGIPINKRRIVKK